MSHPTRVIALVAALSRIKANRDTVCMSCERFFTSLMEGDANRIIYTAEWLSLHSLYLERSCKLFLGNFDRKDDDAAPY